MQISMYRASVPVFARSLRNLGNVLRKGEAHALARKIEPSVLLNYRLAPDMFPLTRQVQIATDMAKGCVSRLAGVDSPRTRTPKRSFADLFARLDRCSPSSRASSRRRSTDRRPDHHAQAARQHVSYEGQPNLLESCCRTSISTARRRTLILRHCGVELGKKDFIGQA